MSGATTQTPSSGVAASPPTSVQAPGQVTPTPAEAPASAAAATVAAAAVPGTLAPTANLHVDSQLGEMIGSKRLKDIDDHTQFAQSLQDFFNRNEKKDFGRKAVEAVDSSRNNDSLVVLGHFHEDKKESINGPWKGQENLMCIIYYLIVKNGEMTIHDLFEMLRACAPENTDAIKKELMTASYN
ncbi:uncharacterized protein LOC135828400 [Sycon ciliatum]|uniref:uncharacterized protein LOC135828400 n=1 Tax=Sycon ciliatum TaxID=27933 RepID=UPI0031F6F038